MQEADPQLLDALNDLRQQIETLSSGVSALTQAVDELRGDGELALTNEAADLSPTPSLPVDDADPPVPQVVRREHRHAGPSAGARNRSPQAVGAHLSERAATYSP